MSIWQTKKWQEMLKHSGQVSEFFEVEKIFIEKRKISMWEYWLFVLWVEENISEEKMNKLINLCKKENTLFIQIETLNYNNYSLPPLDKGEVRRGFYEWYYKKFITPYTAIIDLQKSEEEILADMKPKWRYNIKLADKKWIIVKKVEKTKENIKKYYEIMIETTSRDNFSWNSLKYYEDFLNKINSSELLFAFKDDEIIAWWIFIFDKDVSIYYYWASTSDKKYRNLMAPYLVQWEAIKIAKSIDSKIYDFLWVTSPLDKNSSLAWVTDFKSKFSSDFIEVSKSYIFVNKKSKYFIINLLRKILNK